ncbi:glycosyl hydrolases family 2, TIM barrel domain-containing protein [Ditylenchus destructor]|nr:glycosyl hydrolases family 2, TIM barrel domain-containing protein [Ditylenchus destructor]
MKVKIISLICLLKQVNGLLFPQQNELRSLDSLDGLWTFVREPPNSAGIGLQNNWAGYDLSTFTNATVMPVPSAFNDITVDREIRDHIGWVWYQTTYMPSKLITDAVQSGKRRAIIRFGSVQYSAYVFVNDRLTIEHTGGHLPFEAEIEHSIFLKSVPIVITVAVNNTLSQSTIPPGDFHTQRTAQGHEVVKQTPGFDFFNYAGILRSVFIQYVPNIFVSGIRIQAGHLHGTSTGTFSYRIDIDQKVNSFSPNGNITARVVVYAQKTKNRIYEGIGLQNYVEIPNVDLWWPKGYGEPHLYIAEIQLALKESANETSTETIDIYRESFGFRSVTFDSRSVYINGIKFYCKGFGMHEDFEIIGRGFNMAVMTKDFNMLEWMGGNCYRTSHYPYSEERAYEADRRGIVVITETPAVGMKTFVMANQKLHAKMLTEMILRDQNHPSVIMWSISNEPHTEKKESRQYYRDLITLARHLDPSRPVTMVYGPTDYNNDQTADLVDVLCINRYYGWYSNMGYLRLINESLVDNLLGWRKKFNKPLIVTEYGADSIIGLSEQPGVDFSEQYQVEVMQHTYEAFNTLIRSNDLAGEMIWNFADFMTAPSTIRAVGNHKGVLTRSRKPKMSAYVLRNRYRFLGANDRFKDEL